MTEFLLPGDKIILKNVLSANKKHKICGRGINIYKNDSYSTVAGFLHENREKFWVNSHYRRYFPQSGDKVIGIVTQKLGDIWKVDIGGIEKGEIDFMSFENATKKNRPDVKIGDLLYVTVNIINKHLEPVLTCIDNTGRAKGMGILPRTGTIFTVSCSYCRRLLTDSCKIMESLGKLFAFESTVGVNGRIWVNGGLEDVRIIKKLLLRLESIEEKDVETSIDTFLKEIRGVIGPDVKMEAEDDVEIKDEIEMED